jgi:predicted aspartyl protease
MGGIICQVTVRSAPDDAYSIRFDALVDTGASHLVLPAAWRERLGPLRSRRDGVAGPVEVEIECFRPVFTEVRFAPVEEPLVGGTVLAMIPAAVDMLGHRLVHAGALDLK